MVYPPQVDSDRGQGGAVKEMELADTLREILSSQSLAALATQDEGQPYTCLVAIAATDDLKHLLFATFRHTRKYRELKADPRVAILVDSRSNRRSDFQEAMAVTATGRAAEANGEEKDRLLTVYLAKHPHLAGFAGSEGTALIRIDVADYVLSSFQEVRKLQPG
jgi:nitroimidazol reductase NimA-like FMN-containing flavoprotein (pyridoxamine 5'-phosphate oxidase superfamily)